MNVTLSTGVSPCENCPNRTSPIGKSKEEYKELKGNCLKRETHEWESPKGYLCNKIEWLISQNKYEPVNRLEENTYDIDRETYLECKKQESRVKELLDIFGDSWNDVKQSYPEESFFKNVIDQYEYQQKKHILITLAIDQLKFSPIAVALLRIIYRPREIPICAGDGNLGIPPCRDLLTCQRPEKNNGCVYHTAIYRNPIAFKTKNAQNWLSYVGTTTQLEYFNAEAHQRTCGGGKKRKAIHYDDNMVSNTQQMSFSRREAIGKGGKKDTPTGYYAFSKMVTNHKGWKVDLLRKESDSLFQEKEQEEAKRTRFKQHLLELSKIKLTGTPEQVIIQAGRMGLLWEKTVKWTKEWDKFLDWLYKTPTLEAIETMEKKIDAFLIELVEELNVDSKKQDTFQLKRGIMKEIISTPEFQEAQLDGLVISYYPISKTMEVLKPREIGVRQVNHALEEIKEKLRSVFYFEGRRLRVKQDFYAPIRRSLATSKAIGRVDNTLMVKVVELSRSGWTQDQIKRELGLKQHKISRIIKKFKNNYLKSA